MANRLICMLGLFALLIVTGCKSNSPNTGADEQADAPTPLDSDFFTVDTTGIDNREETRATREEIAAFVERWNDAATSLKDIASLPTFYADEVSYYGDVVDRNTVGEIKKSFIAANPQVLQSIVGNVIVEVHTPNVSKANYTRSIRSDNGVNVVTGYLMLEKFGDSWKIIAESDQGADAARQRKAMAPVQEKDITSCEKAAEAIFRSSPVVQGLLTRPNVKYKIEHKPGEPDNPNRRYWFWVYGNAANAGQSETFGRFQVDPATGQLYQYDAVEGKTQPIASTPTLKKYIQKYCAK